LVHVEIGSGIGQHTGFLTEVFDQVIAVDISAQMLANAPALGGRRDAVTSDAGWGSWSVLRRT
jgi:protein-L-isoaspartate O-methyltransferase